MVPLIAMDELPTHFNIRNVPRTLLPCDVVGMTCAGKSEARHLQHVVDMQTSFSNSPLYDRSISASRPAPGFEQHPHQLDPAAKCYEGVPKAFGIQEQPPALSNVSPSAMPVAGTIRTDRKAQPLPDWHDTSKLPLQAAPGVKEYCSYWLRHGECDYAQQGCLYKHEMPLDPIVLSRLGHRDIPRWYREKHGLASYLSASNTLGAADESKCNRRDMMDRDWRKAKSSEDDVGAMRQPTTKMGRATSKFQDVRNELGTTVRQSQNTQGNARRPTANVTQCRTQPPKSYNQFQSLNPNARLQPTETLAERQTRETLAALKERDAKQAERLSEFERTKALLRAPAPAPATNGSETRPSTATSSKCPSTESPFGKGIQVAATETSVESSISEDISAQTENDAPRIPTLSTALTNQPMNQSGHTSKATKRSNVPRGKKRSPQKGRRHVKPESGYDGQSTSTDRDRMESSASDHIRDEKHPGLYDHDD